VDKATPLQIDKLKQSLLAAGVVVEDYGGDVQCAEVSAKEGTGISELLEKILVQVP
jgi:translation initiation factor IF-2